MIQFSEYVSLGHPDKIADYISSYLLDRYIERDPATRYAVEVQIKNNRVTLGGEVSSQCKFTPDEIAAHVRAAVNEIGYTREYLGKWGAENTICGDLLMVESLITQQSPEIAQGLRGWDDIKGDIETLVGGFQWHRAQGYNCNSSTIRAKFMGMTMAEYMRWLWNNPQAGQSPYKLFEGALVPTGKDEEGNIIYKYNGAKF